MIVDELDGLLTFDDGQKAILSRFLFPFFVTLLYTISHIFFLFRCDLDKRLVFYFKEFNQLIFENVGLVDFSLAWFGLSLVWYD